MRRSLERELTPKQHAFAFNIVEGDGPSEAYRRAFNASAMSDDSVSVEAARLMRNSRVKTRIAELRENLQRALGYSRATLLRELDDVVEAARSQGNAKTWLACVMAKAKILGFVDAPAKPRARSEPDLGDYLGIDASKIE